MSYGNRPRGSQPEPHQNQVSTQLCPTETQTRELPETPTPYRAVSTQLCPTETKPPNSANTPEWTCFHTIMSYGNPLHTLWDFCTMLVSTQLCPTETRSHQGPSVSTLIPFPHNYVLRKHDRGGRPGRLWDGFPHNYVLRKPSEDTNTGFRFHYVSTQLCPTETLGEFSSFSKRENIITPI